MPVTLGPGTDLASARPALLRAADVPGWQQAAGSTAGADAAPRALADCALARDPAATHVLDIGSPRFEQGDAALRSDVTTFHTAAAARAEVRAIADAALAPCGASLVTAQLPASLPAGAALSAAVVTHLPPPGGPRPSFAVELRVTVTVPDQGSATVVEDVAGELVGRAELELTGLRSDGTAPDRSLEQRLLSVLGGRVGAALR